MTCPPMPPVNAAGAQRRSGLPSALLVALRITPALVLCPVLVGAAPLPPGGPPGGAVQAPSSAPAREAGTFDHSHAAWTRLLGRFVRDGSVDYAGLRAGTDDLRSYLASLEAVRPAAYEAWSRSERLAFWINAYNAYTVRLILEHYPVESIKDIGSLFKSPFSKVFIPLRGLRGRDLSLEDIEHGILRKELREPRIHFAIVCASKGCPALRAEAYRAADLERQLDEAARGFLRDPMKNRIDLASRTLALSPIFKWFREDFEGASGSLPEFVARLVDEPTSRALREGGRFRIEFLDYDWTLNGR